MWDEYADGHRGVCFQFKNRIFAKEKKVERVDVSYTADGKLHPLDLGYVKSYSALYSTKHETYQQEDEVRFFLFGDARPIPLRAADIEGIILGSEALKPLTEDEAENKRRKHLTSLCTALDRMNRTRSQHPWFLKIAGWSGFGLRVRNAIASEILRDHEPLSG
jgi:Protein of unknown function (DUF2971)